MMVVTPQEASLGGGCVICSGGIDRNTQTMAVDTLYDFDLPGDPLDGRKYVCQGCVSDIVRTCGLMQATEVSTLQSQLSEFKTGYQNLLDHVRGLSAELGDKVVNNLPIFPDTSFARPNGLVVASEALENEKPKRGRPAKAPF